MLRAKKAKVYNYGMKDKSPGCSISTLNGTPTADEIVKKILKLKKK